MVEKILPFGRQKFVDDRSIYFKDISILNVVRTQNFCFDHTMKFSYAHAIVHACSNLLKTKTTSNCPNQIEGQSFNNSQIV